MQADVVDMDAEARKAKIGRAGTLFGLWGVATKVPLAVGVGIAFPILQYSGFKADTETNSADSLLVLAALYGLLPVAFKLLAIMIIWQYPRDK
jgi:Na+/melibiose symporter-like transporter